MWGRRDGAVHHKSNCTAFRAARNLATAQSCRDARHHTCRLFSCALLPCDRATCCLFLLPLFFSPYPSLYPSHRIL